MFFYSLVKTDNNGRLLEVNSGQNKICQLFSINNRLLHVKFSNNCNRANFMVNRGLKYL